MIKTILSWSWLLLIVGCSGEPKYIWKAYAGEYFLQYQNMMLANDQEQAVYYFKQAVQEAKKATDLQPLAQLYLGACAMDKALFVDTNCTGYQTLKPLVDTKKLDAYDAFIQAESFYADENNARYEDVINAINKNSALEALESVENLESVASQAIAASVMWRNGIKTIDLANFMIDRASYHNLVGLLTVWMEKKLLLLQSEDKAYERLKAHIRLLSIK